MNKLKRTAALLMAAGLSLSMLAGCGTPGQDSTSASPGAEQNATEDAAKGYTYKIATVRWNDTWPTDFLTDGVMGDLAKEADIDIEWQIYYSNDFGEQKALLFASDDLPDAFFGSCGLGDSDIVQNKEKLLELTDLINEETMPNLMKIFEEDPTMRMACTDRNGQIYSLPKKIPFRPKLNSQNYINKEWLDNLNLEMPTNYDELKEVLIAFKEQDADGDGDPNNEIPISGYKPGYGSVLLDSFDLIERGDEHMSLDANNKVVFVPTQDHYKEAVKYLRELWELGVMDEEYFTQEGSMYTAKLQKEGGSQIGIFAGWTADSWAGPNTIKRRKIMARVMKVQKSEAIAHFQYEGRLIKDEPFGNGHINDTFLLTFELNKMGRMKAILQRMNNSIFEEPVQLMENILGVTDFLREKIAAAGGDPTRETLSVIPAVDGKPYYKDSFGDYWRSYIFITDATSFDQVERPEQFYQSGVAFGNFQRMLADYPADTLFEVIKGFHDTKARLEVFKKAVEADVMGRAKDVQEEIRFVLDREDVANYLCDCLANGEIPLRVTHNDTKLNNVMIDNVTGKGLCVIDLDTVMPGLSVNDFGDSIRFGASTAAEDEIDLDKVSCSMEYFEAYTKGFVEGCDGKLTAREMELLPMGAKTMTYECGMRFLTDYLEGDHYFKVHREGHNLDRCRTQLKLVSDMEKKLPEMQKIVNKYK